MTAAQLDNYYRNEIPTPGGGRGFFVNPNGTPAQVAAINAGAEQDWALGQGTTFNQENAKRTVQQQINSAIALNHNAAQQQADRYYQEYQNPAATPLQREAALAHFNALWQWTGDKPVLDGGVVKNSRTGLPLIGTIAQQGLTPEGRSAAFADGLTPVVVGGQLPQPKWAATGYPSLQAYVDARTGASQIGGASPPAVASTTAPPTSGSTPAATTAPPARSATSPAPAPAPVSATGGSPYEQQALASAAQSPAYRADNGPPAVDQATLAARTARMEANQKNSVALGATASEIINEQANVKMYLTSALDILNSRGNAPWTGFPGQVRAAISEKFNGVDAANYVAVSKYLMNAAVQQGHTNFPNATQSEFAQQVSSMSPSAKMPPQAIRELAHMGLRTANWMIASADRAQVWAKDQALDPLAFPNWNQQYFPRDKLVNADKIATNPRTHERMYRIDGKWTQ